MQDESNSSQAGAQSPLKDARRIVVKLGTGVLTSGVGQLDTARIATLCKQFNALRTLGLEVIVVSSGAVGLGMGKLGLTERPRDLATLQACAAVGQSILINTWQLCFDPHGLTVGQILLTREDLRARHRHNAVCNTIDRLLAQGAVPIVNENDTVSAAEIRFGDNDTLSALVASVSQSDLLFILSNIPGLMDLSGSGDVIHFVESITPEIEALAQGTNATTSVGGMVSKISAAKIAGRAGCGVYIGSGKDPGLFDKIWNGETIGTYFAPLPEPIKAKKRWIAIQDHVYGTLTVDAGAGRALLDRGKSLLAAGITNVEGLFDAGDLVAVVDSEGQEIARGVIAHAADDLQLILEETAFTDKDLPEHVVIHRDNLLLTEPDEE